MSTKIDPNSRPVAGLVERTVRPGAEALTVARILEIRDALLPSQGEPFDCVAFAVEIVKAERARAADDCPAMPEPYTRQWINAPFTERLLFTEDQMRQYAVAAAAEARALADSEGTRAVNYLRRARKAEKVLRELVALEDMRLRLRQLHEMGHGTDYADYHRLLPLAWDAAREVLGPNAEVTG